MRQQPLFRSHQRGELVAHVIVADHRHERCLGAQRQQVAHHVAGTAKHALLALLREYGNGRLGRNPLHRAIHEAVEHHIADHQHPRAVEAIQMTKNILRRGHGRVIERLRR